MVTVPRPITGSVGSRVRLVFGDSGDEWLVLLDHDNGDAKWQVKDYKAIPHAVAKQLNNCTDKGRDVKGVDFGPGGTWYINGVKPDGSGGHSWWGGTSAGNQIKEWTSSPRPLQVSFGSGSYGIGIETHALLQGDNGYSISGNLHNDLRERVKRIHSRKKKINFIRLFHGGKFFASDTEGTLWLLHNDHLEDEIKKNKVEEIAVAGDGSWVVVHENRFQSSVGVDENLKKKLSKFFSDQRRWGNERRQEIIDANAAIERERVAREREAQEAREAAERAERERIQRERREAERLERERREEAERLERERREEAERIERERREEAERAEREAQDAANLCAATRISALEARLEERLAEEAKDIRETEANLRRRKRSFYDALQSMPAPTRSRLSLGNDTRREAETNSTSNACVVCHDEPAVMAVIPCGHVCLCSKCSDACIIGRAGSRACPLCRGNMTSVLRIYMGS